MSDALARLADAGRTLSAALDGHDAAAIEGANRRLGEAATALATAGAWRATPELQAELRHARALLDAARARVNYLADQAARRLDRLAALTGAPRVAAYGRHGLRR